MPDANALNFVTLQDAVLGRRFPAASQRTNAKRWLATAYADVWAAEEWTFKRVSRATISFTSGDTTPTMPADFQDAIDLFDQTGFPLKRYSQEEFEERYADVLVASSGGSPEAYTVVNRQIEVAPIPGVSTSFRLSYRRRLASRTAAGVVQAGMMAIDSDYPFWDDHHAVLIPRAIALGLQELNDPTWQDPQAEFERQLERMKDDYVQIRPAVQWGAYSY